jgi:arylsulfatase A-like enzyme
MRPNIVYIHSHDTGRYIQPYGHAIATPNMQRFAEQGVLFRQAFCAGPTCSPSRAALLTGQSPHQAGMLGLAHRGWSLSHPERHLVHTLRTAGYTSALAGVQHVHESDEGFAAAAKQIGYDEYLGHWDHAETYAAEYIAKAGDQPFFLSVGFFETHRAFPSPKEARDSAAYVLPPAPLPDTPETRRDMACYMESVRRYDEKAGLVLDALEQAGLAENTLVIWTTDHGIAFPRMKCTLHDSGTGVMLMMRGPQMPAATVVDAMVGQIDVFATICDLLDIDRPEWLEGESLLGVIHGDAESVHDYLFSEITWHGAYEPVRAVRTDRWKYIRRFEGDQSRPLRNTDGGASRDFWVEHGWAERPLPAEALYDLMLDPNEMDNLIDDPARADVADDLRGVLQSWMVRTGDPLLTGPVPAPSNV